MNKIPIILIIMFFVSIKYTEAATLQCSARGTVIYTVNGVTTRDTDAKINRQAVEDVVKDISKQVDEKNIYSVKYIYNPSYHLPADVLEGVVQELKAKYKVKNPWSYIYQVLNGVDLVYQVTNPRFIGRPKDINFNLDDNSSMALDFTKKTINYLRISNAILAQADSAVVNNVKNDVKESLDQNYKVIIIPHSQGNFVVNNAMENLKDESNFESDYSPILGVVHVATPSGHVAISKSASIKLNSDAVVNNLVVRAISLPPTYQQKYYISDNFAFTFNLNILTSIITQFTSSPVDVLGHSMIETYLSTEKSAKKIGGNGNFYSMKQIFESNLISVAESLGDNCKGPVIKISSLDANGTSIKGFASAGKVININIKDIAGDANEDGVDEHGYESKKTEFEYELLTSHPDFSVIKGVVKNNSNVSFPAPWADLGYTIKVKATNSQGEISNASKTFSYVENKKLTASAGGFSCETDDYGDQTGVMKYTITSLDDEYLVNNRVSSYATYERTHKEYANDRMYSVELNIINNCERTVVGHTRYEVWSSCQATGCINIEPFDPQCYLTDTALYNTGLQYNRLRIWFDNGEEAMSAPLGSGQDNTPMSYFIDPNDPTKRVEYSPGGSCPRGGGNDGTGTEFKQ